MNLESLKQSLRTHEGCKLTVYTCTAGKPTIGIGHNLERPISITAAEQILDDDINDCIRDLNRALPWWKDLNDARQNVMVELVFNLGLPTLLTFKKFLSSLQSGDYGKAAGELRNSKWAEQVKGRASVLAMRMEKGV